MVVSGVLVVVDVENISAMKKMNKKLMHRIVNMEFEVSH